MMDCRTEADTLPSEYPGICGNAMLGNVVLSTCPKLANAVNSASPDNFTRYRDMLSTLTCRCSSTRSFKMSQSSCDICAGPDLDSSDGICWDEATAPVTAPT